MWFKPARVDFYTAIFRLSPRGICLLACSGAFAQPTITNIGILPGGTMSSAWGVNADGSAVTGRVFYTGVGNRAFRWTQAAGIEDLLPAEASSYGLGISDDGASVVGFLGSPEDRAFLWNAGSGALDLGILPGYFRARADSISGNGLVVTGSCTDTGFSQTTVFRWTASGGMEELGRLSGDTSAFPGGISPDGNTIVGTSRDASGSERAFRWTADAGMVALGSLPGGATSRGNRANFDGSVVVGSAESAEGTRAYRWTNSEGMVSLGVLPGGAASTGVAVRRDGTVVAGYSGSSSGNRAFIWTSNSGMVDLNEHFASLGVDLTGWVLTECRGFSADGTAMIGAGLYEGQTRAWIVRGLPRTCLADLNSDGLVDLADLTVLLSNFGRTDATGVGEGDLNGDAAVSLSDLSALLAEFGSICT